MTTSELREAWKRFECQEARMATIDFGGDTIDVAPPTVAAWRALAAVFERHGYRIRVTDTDSYNCRAITGGSGKSLHAFGIALDVNWTTNPYIDHAGSRSVRFSDKDDQGARALDVKQALADTDMTEAMIDDVAGIRTTAGLQVFEWGGHWKKVKDAMHFELDVSPEELAQGLDWSTIPQTSQVPAPDAPRHRVNARRGLNLRAGPGTQFSVLDVLPHNTRLFVIQLDGGWALVDLAGDGIADGHVHPSFLRAFRRRRRPQ